MLFAQYTDQQIDSLVQEATVKYRNRGDIPQAMKLYMQALQLAENNSYQEGLAAAHMNIGNIYTLKGNYTESIKHLEQALDKMSEVDNQLLEVRIHSELAQSYNYINYSQKSLESCNTALLMAQEIQADSVRKRNIQYIYSIKASVFEKLNDIPAFFNAITNAYATYPTTIEASRIAKYYLVYHKNIDSARTYLDAANRLWNTGKYPVHQRSILLRIEGLYHYTIQKFQEAVNFYQQSIAISKQMGNLREQRISYKMLYDTYKAIGDKDGKIAALEQYSLLGDSIAQQKDKTTELPIANWLKDQEKKHQWKATWLYIAIAAVMLLALGIVYFLRRQSRHRLEQKEQIIEEKTTEQHVLLKKVNDSYDDLIKLARDNDPAFYFRFQEVYPEFENKILAILPGLRTSELTLCAYLFLGFNAKDIADYTFKAIKTVENRKYNLRKKLQVPTEEDMGIWFRKMMEQQEVM